MLEYHLITDPQELPALAQRIHDAKVIGFDIETTSLDPRKGEIRLMQFGFQGEGNGGRCDIILVDLFQTKGPGPVIQAIFDTKAIWVIHNAKFEQKWLWWHHRLKLWPVFCTFRASSIIYNGKKGLHHDLDSVVWRELQERVVNTGQGKSDWSKPALTQLQKDYAAEDVLRLLPLRDELKKKLVDYDLLKTALIEFGVVEAEGRVELTGLPINRVMWEKLAKKNIARRAELREELIAKLPDPKGQYALPGLGGSWNIDSSKQMLESLRILGLTSKIDDPAGGKKKIRVPLRGTREIELAQHAKRYKLVRLLLEYRGVAQLVKTYGLTFLRHIDTDGRIHPDYYGLLATGRYSANKSLQQIPRAYDFRACFRPHDGRWFVAADYGGIEMRLCAEISGDPELIKVFVDGEDAHYATAAIIMDKIVEEVTKEERQQAKPVNFGLIYGMMPDKLVLYAMANYGVTMTLAQARRYRDRYFARYAGIARWHERVLRHGKRTGFSRTLSGRIRYLDRQAHNEHMNCLDEETEALTARGWVRGFDLRDGDVLLTKSADTGRLEWQSAEIKKWPDYEGPLVEFKSRSFSAVSTPDHRWLVRDKNSGRDMERVTSRISLHGDHRIHRTGEYVSFADEAVMGPNGPVRMRLVKDELVELVGWFLTDGCYTEKKRATKPPKPIVRIMQSRRANPDKVARIDALMDKVTSQGVRVWRSEVERDQMVVWEVDTKMSAALHEMFPRRLVTLRFLRGLASDQLHLLLDTMLAGDGHIEASGKTSFCTRSEEGAGLFQALCMLCGVATTSHRRDMSAYQPQSDLLDNVPRMGVVYYVNILKRDRVQVLKEHRRDFHAKQGVWCPIVPNTFFVARREGHVYITGNTPVQGSGADALKSALKATQERIDKTFGVSPAKTPDGPVAIVHHVHDEILLETDKDDEMILEARQQLHDGMYEGMAQFLTQLPTVVDPADGNSWAEVH
jgi:DNA polymerase-1